MLSPQQNYVYVLSRYFNSLVRTVVLVCLTIVLLVVGTTARIFVFLLYLILCTSSIIWVNQFVKEVRWSEGRRWQRSYPGIYIRVQGAHDLSYECWVWNAVRRKKWIVPGVKWIAGVG